MTEEIASGYWDWEDVPPEVLSYPYNNHQKIRDRDPKYLQHLNEIWNTEWLIKERRRRERKAKAPGGIPRLSCFFCERAITDKQLEECGRICVGCSAHVKLMGEINAHGIKIKYRSGHEKPLANPR